jgi:hypothetical protein
MRQHDSKRCATRLPGATTCSLWRSSDSFGDSRSLSVGAHWRQQKLCVMQPTIWRWMCWRGVTSLLNKSLLQQTEQEGEEPRLLMLEIIREYGVECLAACGELEATRQAHAAYYLRLAEEAEQKLRSVQQALWLVRLEQEHGNLRAALRWLVDREEIEMALRLESTTSVERHARYAAQLFSPRLTSNSAGRTNPLLRACWYPQRQLKSPVEQHCGIKETLRIAGAAEYHAL